MGQFLGIAFIIYVSTASAVLPIILVHSAIAKRDCRIASGENCVLVVVPASKAPEGGE